MILDFLIKNNIIKQNKLIVDIGMFSTKLLEINYAAKKINVTFAKIFDNSRNSDEYELDFENIARRTYEKASGNGRKNVVAVLPTELTENKIITVKNKKEKDIPRIISREHMSFGRVSRITHVVDYAYLGKRIESGDTVMYFLISAVKKSIANDLVSAFAEYKMTVKTIISNIYAQICLSELFFDEYENLNRLFVDFGTNSIRVTAFAEGVAVYTRTIDMGFESYIKTISSSSETAGKSDIVKALNQVGEITGLNDSAYGDVFRYLDKSVYVSCVKEVDNAVLRELQRIIALCSSNDINISKIYITGHILSGFEAKIKNDLNIECNYVEFFDNDEKSGRNYAIFTGNSGIDGEFSVSLGATIYPFI